MKHLLYLFIFLAQLYGDDGYPYRFEGIFEEYDTKRLILIESFLPYNPVVLEAGAHYGEDTARFAQNWPAGKIIAFEPNPHAFKLLQDRVINYSNVQLNNLALNDRAGSSLFFVCYGTGGLSPEFEGASSLLAPTPQMEIHYQGPRIIIQGVVLDQWCEDNKVDHIDFMWLDLEGLELQVLKSSPKILSTVKVIYTETNFYPFRVGTTQYRDLKFFLETSGFVILSHWYREGLQGDAIFIRKELYEALFKGTTL